MKIITSRTNSEIQHIQTLKDSKSRAHYNCFIAEGIRTCETLLKHDIELVSLYITEPLLELSQSLLASHARVSRSDKLVLVSQSVMDKISTAITPSGIVGIFRIPTQKNPEQLTPGLVLVNITDPGNMGTLIRSAAAMGVTSIILIEGTDPWSPKVIQATAGTIGAVSLFKLSWQELLTYKKDKQLYALVVSGGQSLKTIKSDNALLVIGNEAHGLTHAQAQECDYHVTIPMPGNTESLNAAVAGSIALYITFVGR